MDVQQFVNICTWIGIILLVGYCLRCIRVGFDAGIKYERERKKNGE